MVTIKVLILEKSHVPSQNQVTIWQGLI